MKILVVDDDESFRMIISAFLENEDHDLILAKNGEDGFKKALIHRPDLILLDAMMPLIDGFKTCQLIKQNEKINNIPVIMLTALDKVEHVEKAFESGADEYIAKPIEANTFPSILSRKYNRIMSRR